MKKTSYTTLLTAGILLTLAMTTPAFAQKKSKQVKAQPKVTYEIADSTTNEIGVVHNLDEFVIAVQKPLIKVEGDKIAYSVKDDPDAKTNTLLEMLRKVPMVTVDGEDRADASYES